MSMAFFRLTVIGLSIFLFVLKTEILGAASIDSVLRIYRQEEIFPLNRKVYVLKDNTGKLDFSAVTNSLDSFTPLNSEHYYFHEDRDVKVYWMQARIQNFTEQPLRYILYFHPGIDTIETWVIGGLGEINKTILSSLVPTPNRPIRVAQELCAPITLQPGHSIILLRIPMSSLWTRDLGTFIANLAEEVTFVNYFIKVKVFQGFALGIIAIMIIFHLIIFIFFRDRTYLLLVINLFFTIIYLVLLKHYEADLLLNGQWLSVSRYFLNPFGLLVCITSLLFVQSFLNTKANDRLTHQVINRIIAVMVTVMLCFSFMQFLWILEMLCICLGVITFSVVLIASLRSYRIGNKLALYPFIGFFVFVIVVLLSFFPLSFTDYRSNETDYHYYAEAIRAIVFAVGVADRFRRIKLEAFRVEIEKNRMEFEKELQVQAEKDRIRRDLHDSLGSQLSSISVGLSRAISNNKVESLTSLHSLADKAVTELRDSLWVLDKRDISLEELEQRTNSLFWMYRKTDVSIDMNFELNADPSSKLASVIAGHLFRIIQEAVHNTVKHSGASQLRVLLASDKNILNLRVTDNGKGFVVPDVSVVDHFGLQNIRKRADKLNGKLVITSTQSEGTTIQLDMPINEKLA